MDSRELRRDYLLKLARKYNWKHGAELGVLVGWTYFYLLDNIPDLTMIAVDKWPETSRSCTYKNQAENRQEFYEQSKLFGGRSVILEMDTIEATKQVPDESLDFVFIDADHSYESCRNDIFTWLPKIKPTGWITGHDYLEFPSVKKAVDELLTPINCPAKISDETWARPKNLKTNDCVTIVCIKWGRKFGAEYVNKLYNMISRNVSLAKYDFVCLTEDKTGILPHIRTDILPCDYPGWWQKIGLFKRSIEGVYTDKILFIDLDAVIVGDMDRILEYDSDFCILRGWPPEMPEEDQGYFWSAMFMLKVGIHPQVFDNFDMTLATERGDEVWIRQQINKADFFPYDWIPSYKSRKLQNAYPPDASIVMFHGLPLPHECEGWVKEVWR